MCISDRGGSLLPIDDPAGAVLLVEWDEKRPTLTAGIRRLAATVGSEPYARVERDDDPVGDHRRLRLNVGADRVDVRQHLWALVAADGGVVVTADTGDGGEAMQQLP